MRIILRTIILTITFSLIGNSGNAQNFDNDEIGIGLGFGASNLGGNFSVNLKYVIPEDNENIAFGPSIRWNRTWNKNVATNQVSKYNIFGGGAFFHYRFQELLFLGVESEILKTPVNFSLVTTTSKWSPNFFIGGGYSQNFNDKARLNIGLFYDVINHVNSPFRRQYFLKRKTNSGVQTFVPLIYRINFFIPLGN